MAISLNIKVQLSLKNAWLPQFSFWILIALAKICFFHSHKPRKNIFVLVYVIA